MVEWDWQPLWDAAKVTGSMAGLVTAAERLWDRYQRRQSERRKKLPDIECVPHGQPDEAGEWDLRLTVRNNWQNSLVVESVAVRKPAGGLLRDARRRSQGQPVDAPLVKALRLDARLRPLGEDAPRVGTSRIGHGDQAWFDLGMQPNNAGSRRLVLAVVVVLGGARPQRATVTVAVALPVAD
jgi:hypothetical protein